MTKEYYENKYKQKWHECLEQAFNNPEIKGDLDLVQLDATEDFEETANADEIVGFYIYFYRDDAYRIWKGNTNGIEKTKQDLEVDRIFEELFN